MVFVNILKTRDKKTAKPNKMKSLKTILFLALLFLGISQIIAQPYSLKEEIKPIKLELLDDSRKSHAGEKGIVYWNTVSDSANYHYVKGYDMYQMVDVLVSNIENKEPLKVELVKNNWDDVVETKNTNATKDGIVNFKFRDYGNVGIKIEPPAGKSVGYIIAVLASPPKQNHLGSPFKKIKESEMKAGTNNEASASGASRNGSNNTILYIVLGIALLVIGVLGGKLMGKNKSATIFILLFGFSVDVSAQSAGDFVSLEQMEEHMGRFKEQVLRDVERHVTNIKTINSSLSSLDSKLTKIRSLWDDNAIRTLYDGMSNCIPSGGEPGAPNIPSFCDPFEETQGAIGTGSGEDLNGCAECFKSARQAFNQTRYTFEKLAAIYKCTKTYSNAAIALGDNASGVHAVTGIVWQQERAKIMKSVQGLEKAYDKKYVELMQDLQNNMMKLNICEKRFGVENWFDRFGFMYFEFIQEKYKRKG